MWVKGWICAPAPISASRITQCGADAHAVAQADAAFEDAVDVDLDLAAAQQRPRTSSRAGSARRTPASISASAPARWKRRSRSASCTGLLTPSTSVSLSGWVATTGTPSATAMATMSVR